MIENETDEIVINFLNPDDNGNESPDRTNHQPCSDIFDFLDLTTENGFGLEQSLVLLAAIDVIKKHGNPAQIGFNNVLFRPDNLGQPWEDFIAKNVPTQYIRQVREMVVSIAINGIIIPEGLADFEINSSETLRAYSGESSPGSNSSAQEERAQRRFIEHLEQKIMMKNVFIYILMFLLAISLTFNSIRPSSHQNTQVENNNPPTQNDGSGEESVATDHLVDEAELPAERRAENQDLGEFPSTTEETEQPEMESSLADYISNVNSEIEINQYDGIIPSELNPIFDLEEGNVTFSGTDSSGMDYHRLRSSFSFTVNTAGFLKFDYSVYTEQNYDFFEVLVNGRVVGSFSGEVEEGSYSRQLNQGDDVILSYRKDTSISHSIDRVTIENMRIIPLSVDNN